MRLLRYITCTLSFLCIAYFSLTTPRANAAEFSCADVNEFSQVECEALVDIYNGTNGSNWNNNDGWLVSANPCSWYGVGCYTYDDVGTTRYIYELDLSGNNLQGSLPSSIHNIRYLMNLLLSNNQLTSIPPEIGDLTDLQNLFINSNKLTSIPQELGQLVHVSTLNLSDNQLTSIPAEIGNLVGLWELFVDNNQLTSIPAELGNLGLLLFLHLSNNQLTSIPAEIGNLVGLWELGLSSNQLTSVPSEIGNITNLGVLDLSNNKLTSITLTFDQMLRMETLYLNSNSLLTGKLPETLLTLPLEKFRYDETKLCKPHNPDFQTWLASIAELKTSGLYCEAITGRVVKDGFGLSSVNLELILDGIQVNSAATDANGNYHFDTVDPGAYVVKPIRLGYNFLPISQAITIPPNVEDINFQATAISTTYAIHGSISENGFAMPGVTVHISTGGIQLASTTTNSSGEYVFSNLEAEQYTITVERSGYTFSPTSQEITVPPDQSNVDFDATAIPNTYSIQGLVAENSFGLSGVTVRISTGGIQFATTTTNASGEYSFANLDAEQYTLAVERNGFTFSPTSQEITVPPDQANVNFEASAIQSTYSIRGSVSEVGFALSGVTVNLSTDGIQVASTTTDGFGEYTFTDLDAQPYSVSVEHSGYTFSPAAREITVPPDQSNVNFDASAIQTSFSIRGLVSENGFAVPGVTVYISTGDIQFASTTTNVAGEYSFANLEAAQYTIVVEKSGYNFSPASQEISVPPDQASVDFDAVALPTTYNIRGSVSEDGFALPGVTVVISTGGIEVASTTTDSTGEYQFIDLVAELYTITVEKSGYTFSPASQGISVPPDQTGVNFDGNAIQTSYSVRGSVSENGIAMLGATVYISIGGIQFASTTTDFAGGYSFSDLEAEEYTLRVERSGYTFSPTSRNVVVPPDAEGINFDATAIQSTYSIRGTVNVDGFALSGVTVRIGSGGIQFGEMTTGVDGSFAFVNLEPEEYSISVERSGFTFSPTSTSVTVPPDMTGVSFTATAVSPRYSISGKVTENGSGLANVTVSINDGSQQIDSMVTNRDGTYSFANLELGLYKVQAERAGYSISAPRTVVVPPDATNQDFVASVPVGKRPVILLPGFAGSYLEGTVNNEPDCSDLEPMELWPNLARLVQQGSSHLERLHLRSNGMYPENPCDKVNTTGIWYEVGDWQDIYRELETNLTEQGYDVIPCAYDWRRFIDGTTASGTEDISSLLEWIEEECIKPALQGKSALQVDIVAHSTGGLLARAYVLSSPERAAVVNTVVSLGTPYLGSLKVFLMLRYGVMKFTQLDVLINNEDIVQAARNWPAVYQLLPSEKWTWGERSGGYFTQGEPGQSKYKDYSTFQSMQEFLAEHYNADLVTAAQKFHSGTMDDWRTDGLDVKYFVFLGTNIKTPAAVTENIGLRFGAISGLPDGTPQEVSGGDDTVLAQSASLNYGELAGDATICTYPDVSHGALTSDAAVFEDIDAALSGKRVSCKSGDQPAAASVAQNEAAMESRQLVVRGPATVDVWDEAGRHTGPIADSVLIEHNIPLVTYWADAYKTIVSLEPNLMYTVEIQPRESFALDVKLMTQMVREASIGTISETVLFPAIPITPNDKVMLVLDPQKELGEHTLGVAQNSNGTGVRIEAPTAVLSAEESADQIPPVSQIEVQGQQDENGVFVGTVIVTLTATDEGSGIDRVEYSVDGGKTGVLYTGPFEMNVEDVPILYAQASDLAGNTEYPWMELSFVRPQETSTFLPLVSP